MIPIHRRTRFDVTRRACRVGDGSIYVYGSIGDRTVASVSRAMKRVERFDGDEWQTSETHAFTYDGSNIVLERIAFADGSTRTVECFWGNDLSGTEQGAGGVGGLLYVKRNGVIYVPHANANGNILRYTDTAGNVVAAYTYDAFGRTISQSGPLADVFRHRFSTKYFDLETGLYYYGYRFYSPELHCWLNRDPLEERGGVNLYSYVRNNAISLVDPLGLLIITTHDVGATPSGGWQNPCDAGLTIAKFRFPNPQVILYSDGKQGYKVFFDPLDTRIDIYFRLTATVKVFSDELDHVRCYTRYDEALETFKREVGAILACPAEARKLYKKAQERLREAERECKRCDYFYDRRGGPHGH